jgi:hypothetical protein
MVPASAVQPKTYHARTRQEYLDNLRYAAGLRAGRGGAESTRLPITLDHALAAVDNIYGIWQGGERVGHHLTPAQRLDLAKKMVAGTVQPQDFPDIPGENRGGPEAPGAAAPPDTGEGIIPRAWHWLMGRGGSPTGTGAAPTTPSAPTIRAAPPAGGGTPGAPVAPTPGGMGEGADRQAAIDQARALIQRDRQQYRDIPPDQLEAALADEGYSDEEIRLILGATGP